MMQKKLFSEYEKLYYDSYEHSEVTASNDRKQAWWCVYFPFYVGFYLLLITEIFKYSNLSIVILALVGLNSF